MRKLKFCPKKSNSDTLHLPLGLRNTELSLISTDQRNFSILSSLTDQPSSGSVFSLSTDQLSSRNLSVLSGQDRLAVISFSTGQHSPGVLSLSTRQDHYNRYLLATTSETNFRSDQFLPLHSNRSSQPTSDQSLFPFLKENSVISVRTCAIKQQPSSSTDYCITPAKSGAYCYEYSLPLSDSSSNSNNQLSVLSDRSVKNTSSSSVPVSRNSCDDKNIRFDNTRYNENKLPLNSHLLNLTDVVSSLSITKQSSSKANDSSLANYSKCKKSSQDKVYHNHKYTHKAKESFHSKCSSRGKNSYCTKGTCDDQNSRDSKIYLELQSDSCYPDKNTTPISLKDFISVNSQNENSHNHKNWEETTKSHHKTSNSLRANRYCSVHDTYHCKSSNKNQSLKRKRSDKLNDNRRTKLYQPQ